MRTSVTGFMDSLDLVVRTIVEFGDDNDNVDDNVQVEGSVHPL